MWGAIYATGTLSSALLMFSYGGVVDRYNIKTLTTITFIAFSVFCFMMMTVSSLWVLPIIIFGLRFCGQGFLSHISIVLAGKWFVRNRGKTVAISGMGFSLAEAFYPFLFVSIMATLGWRLSWGLAGVILLIIMFIIRPLLTVERKTSSQELKIFGKQTGMKGRHWKRSEVLKSWVFWALLPAVIAQSMFGTTYFFQQVHLTEFKGWELQTFAAMVPFYTVTSLISLFGVGFLIDKYKTGRVLPFCLLPGVIGFTTAASTNSIMGAALAFSFLGMLQGISTAVAGAFWPEYFGTKYLGSVRAVASSTIVFASALGPLISGILLDNRVNLNIQFYGMAFFLLLFTLGLISITLFAKINDKES